MVGDALKIVYSFQEHDAAAYRTLAVLQAINVIGAVVVFHFVNDILFMDCCSRKVSIGQRQSFNGVFNAG